jgi:hypothetical protein
MHPYIVNVSFNIKSPEARVGVNVEMIRGNMLAERTRFEACSRHDGGDHFVWVICM